MAGKEKNKSGKGFFDTVGSDISKGISILSDSFAEGFSRTTSHQFLIIKYTLLAIVLSVVYALLSQIPYFTYTIVLPLSLLILTFYHEMLQIKITDKKRVAANTLMLSLILFVIYLLFSFNAPSPGAVGPEGLNSTMGVQQTAPEHNIPSILASSAAIFLFALFLFMPIYMVKAGATPVKAVRSAFTFVSRNSMKTMTYMLILIILISFLSMLPSAIGLAVLSPLLFMLLSYAMLIFIYSFWEKCREESI